jgi:hypothetical protein
LRAGLDVGLNMVLDVRFAVVQNVRLDDVLETVLKDVTGMY